MITDISYDAFCTKYYLDARQAADVTVADFIIKYGRPHYSLDLDLIKDVAISKALKKAYDRYDSDKGNAASVKTFLSTIVHNQVLTSLRDESTAIKTDMKQSLDISSYEVEGSGGPLAEDEEIIKMRSRITECVGRLDSIDQVIVNCWMESKRTFVDNSLSKLGWGEDRRDEVRDRKKQAFIRLRTMLHEFEPENDSKKESKSASDSLQKMSKDTVYVYDVPLSFIDCYAGYIRKYFGLFHPSLEPELSLLKNDPDRTFELVAFVPWADIETAFDGGDFPYDEGTKKGYVDLFWLVANIYYGDQYEQYKNYFATESSYDDLTWEETQDDIRRFYDFIQAHKEESPITIKIGRQKVVLNDVDRWFQALAENHLFIKCLPESESRELATERLRKNPGRKVENRVAVAIINGIANLFTDEGLIKGRAPKNLCSFIRQYLILMDVLNRDDSVISLPSIKAAINYAAKKGIDTRLPSTEFTEVSVEHLRMSGVNPGHRWLFSKED